jgi:hypothetical protein
MNLWRCSKRPTPCPLRLEVLESRDVPTVNNAVPFINVYPFSQPEVPGSPFVPVNPNPPAITTVQLDDPTGNPLLGPVIAFPGFTGQVTATAGDVTGDGVPDLIVAAQNASGFVEVIDGTTGAVAAVKALFPGFTGQVSVGVADLSGKGYADILLAARAPGAPVIAYDARQGQVVAAFFAFPGYNGPVSVAGTDGSGRDQILVGAAGLVGVFGPSGALAGVVSVLPGYRGPLALAGGPVTGTDSGDILVGIGADLSNGIVGVFGGGGSLLGVLSTNSGYGDNGMLLATGASNVEGDGQPDILVADLTNPGAGVTAYDGMTTAQLTNFPAPDNGSSSSC